MKIGNKKIIIIISSVIVILVIVLIILFNIFPKNNVIEEINKEKKAYQAVEDFKTVKEVADYLDCKYIKEEESIEKDFIKDIYINIKYEPFTDDSSNQGFYNNLISYSANVLDYRSFRIIDQEKDITIQVICNKETKKIKDIIINGESNYFEKRNSYLELENIKKEVETELNIKSEILNNIIKNNWDSNIASIGKKDSTFRKYDIYLNKGIEVRNVDGKIFNIIFNKNYKENIINNIKTTSSKEDIIKELGEPTFKSDEQDCIGYKGKEIYLFYNSQNEISIYRVEKEFDSSELITLINKFYEDNDITNLIKSVKNKYTNYDEYTEYENGANIKYTLNGLQIKFNNTENDGIIYYNNYIGNIYNDLDIEKAKETKDLPEGLNIKNENLIENYEYQRIGDIERTIETASLFEYNHPGLKISNKFYVIQTQMSDGTTKIEFVSKDGKEANSELRQNIDTAIWIDDYNFVYGIENSGIYVYNASLKKYVTIVTGKGEFQIKGYEDKVLKYDDKSVIIK